MSRYQWVYVSKDGHVADDWDESVEDIGEWCVKVGSDNECIVAAIGVLEELLCGRTCIGSSPIDWNQEARQIAVGTRCDDWRDGEDISMYVLDEDTPIRSANRTSVERRIACLTTSDKASRYAVVGKNGIWVGAYYDYWLKKPTCMAMVSTKINGEWHS